jgi:uncharacterized membrane protein
MAIRCGIVAWMALLLLQLAWHSWLMPPANGRIGLALALTLPPLLLPLLALRRGIKRSLLWVGIVSLGYFCHGVVIAWALPSMRLMAVAEVILCVALIATLAWIVSSDRPKVSAR